MLESNFNSRCQYDIPEGYEVPEISEEEKNKIKEEAIKVRKQPVYIIRKVIKENYEIGIEYYQEIEEHEE